MSSEALEYVIRIRGGSEGAAEIRKVDDAIGGTTGRVKTLGEESTRSTKKLGGMAGGVRGVGKALLAAGAGFVAWEAGKKAFGFTEELVKSTKQLTAATGMSTAESSRWAGVTAAVGGNAGQSAMAFQKLASAAQKQTDATHKGIAAHKLISSAALAGTQPLERLGISTAYLEKHQKNLGPVMEEVVSKIHGMSNSTARASVLSNLFGRGWKQLSPILLEGKDHLDGLLKAAKEMGVELKGNSADALEQLREKQIRASLATESLRLRFTELAAKPMGDVLQGFSALTLAIEKNEWGKFNEQAVKIGTTFTKIAEVILPHVAESFGHMAPIILKAFVHGFMSASLGGQAVIAAVLLHKLGLDAAVFRGAGHMAVKAFTATFAGEEASFAIAGTAAGAAFEVAFVAAGVVGAVILGKKIGEILSPAKTEDVGPHGEHWSAERTKGQQRKEESKFHSSLKTPKQRHEAEIVHKRLTGLPIPHQRHAPAAKVPALASGGLPQSPFAAGGRETASVGDIHVHIDGRKLFRVNARQALEEQAAGG